MSNIDQKIRKEATGVLGRVLLFLLYYVGLIVLGVCLFVVAGWATFQLPDFLGGLEYINVRGLIIGVLAFLAMWWFCIEIGIYLIRPLFGISEPTISYGREVERKDCPELFSLIEEVATKTSNPMPLHVYITTEVNASVSYDSVTLWSVIFPPKKNLTLGTGLLYGMNNSEIKAILGHEFGHFSQKTMRIGTLTYRLLLVTRNIYEFTQEKQKDDAIAKASPDYKWYFHLASGPINFITKQTIAFYRYIEKKNRSLSRYMEFEADNVACRIVGPKAHISALCKLDVLSRRSNIYENSIVMLLKEGNYLEDYFEGYKYMFNLLADDESLHVGYQNILSSPISDETAIPSRIKVIDGWNTHPALSERIENATKHKGEDEVLEKDDACELIPKEVFNSVGESREKEIAVGLEPPVSWGKIKPIPWDDYKNWLSEKLKNHKIPQYLQPFVNKGIFSVKLPSDEELANEYIISPFTKENRHLMLEFSQASRDWDTLVEIKQSDDEIRFTYEGKEIDVSSAIERHKAYLETFNSRLEDLDTNIYKYIWKLSEDKSHLHAMYWLMFFSNDGLNALQRLHQAADEIISTTRFYKENGSPIRIKDEILRDISKGFREFMASFDFSTVSSLCGGWDVGEGKTVNQLLQEWQDYLSEDSTSFDGTVNRIEEVWNLLARMFNVSNTDWQGCMVSAYNGLIIPKIKESDSFAEKYNNTESHLPFIGEGSNKSYEYARFSFENYNRDFNSLLSIAYDNLNHYFASLGMEYGHGWSWLQTYPQQMRFQHLCISYKTYVLSIIVGLYRETDGHGQLFVNNKDNENLLRECERYNLTPCIFVVDCADGTPRLSEPYLVDARTHEPLNLAKIAEDNDGIMSDWEIHNIGIQCACEYLKKQGITKISYSDVIGIHPQIWFEKDGKQCYALVRSIPAGLHEQKYEITSGQQNRYSEFKGYFFDVHWNMMLGNNGDFRDKRLFRENNPWNLVHRLELKPIEEAIKEYEFIEIVEGESYDIK